MKNILVVSLGSSPSVVTETIWALNVRVPSFWPDELHLVTTQDSYNRGLESLIAFSEGQTLPGPKIKELCDDLGRPEIDIHLHIPAEAGADPISDIKTEKDAILFGDGIAELVRLLTEDADTKLHLSIAGGRKTMSYHAGATLTLYGRAQDELSHILVSPQELEGCREFWWPTQTPASVSHAHLKDKTGAPQRFSAHVDDVHLDLILTPFFRARPYLPKEVLTKRMDYAAVVSYANAVRDANRLIINPAANQARISDIDLNLSPSEMALYAVFARYARDELQALCARDFEDLAPNGPAMQYQAFRDSNPAHVPRINENPSNKSTQFNTLMTRLNNKISALNDRQLIQRYGLSAATRGNSYYQIMAPPEEIELHLGDQTDDGTD